MVILWVTVSFNFYMLGFYISNMEGDINMNSLTSGIAMILAFVIGGPIISKVGYHKCFAVFFTMTIIASLLYVATPEKSENFISFLVFVGRLGICPCYSLTFISSNELFPAKIKSTLFAFCNIIARGLCMLAPIVAGWADPIPFGIFGMMSFLCCIAT